MRGQSKYLTKFFYAQMQIFFFKLSNFIYEHQESGKKESMRHRVHGGAGLKLENSAAAYICVIFVLLSLDIII